MRCAMGLMVSVMAIPVSTAPALAQETLSPAKSHAVLKGTLIGLAAGVAGGAWFFGGTNCHYGSDSAGAMVAVGHPIANGATKPPRAARSGILWRRRETVNRASL